MLPIPNLSILKIHPGWGGRICHDLININIIIFEIKYFTKLLLNVFDSESPQYFIFTIRISFSSVKVVTQRLVYIIIFSVILSWTQYTLQIKRQLFWSLYMFSIIVPTVS